MQLEDAVRRFPPVRKASSLYYHYRARRWRFDPRYRIDDPAQPIDRPIFLLGTMGGGLTLQLGWREDVPGWSDAEQMWLYASDPILPYYREDAASATPELERHFERILRGLLRLNRPPDPDTPGRFLDKSQTFTVRVGLVHRLLEDCRPKFVLVTRDPFAMSWRFVTRNPVVRAVALPERERFALATSHWKNSFETALRKQGRADLRWWRFEDILDDPARRIREICEFIEVPYDPAILPQPDDRVPWGSMLNAYDRSKWYPVRPHEGAQYLREIPGWAVEHVATTCAPLIQTFGYEIPGA